MEMLEVEKASMSKVDKQSFCIVVSSSESETEVITDESDSDWEKIDWAPAEYQTETESSVESGLSKRRRLSESWLADALSLGDHPRVSDLYSFMRRRETARIRKEMGLPPNQWYPAGDLMRTVFLTNVRREDDVTTRAVRVALQPALETWKELGPSGRHHLAGLVVFHCALWRTFGTKEFIRKLGFLESLETWKEESWQQVVDVALSCWERGELCFTEAYCPSRLWRKWEVGAFRDPKGKERVGSLFQEVCRSQLRGIWEHRFDIVRVAESGCSWRQVVQAIMAVPHYGGTGFRAKELAEDLLRTPLFCTWNSANGSWDNQCHDMNEWCPVGPGARRGLNRLHGRPTKQNCYSSSRAVQESFIQELLAVYRQRQLFWDPSHMIDELCPSGELTLHDIQFQLCEFDKYERAKRQEGFVRRYVPSEEPMQARLSSGDRTNRTKKGLTTNKPLRTGEI